MSEQITTQIIFRGQVVEAKFFRCGGQAFVMAAVSGDDLPATKLHPSEEQEIVVLNSDAVNQLDSESAKTIDSQLYQEFILWYHNHN